MTKATEVLILTLVRQAKGALVAVEKWVTETQSHELAPPEMKLESRPEIRQ
jgi:hypothetical protein